MNSLQYLPNELLINLVGRQRPYLNIPITYNLINTSKNAKVFPFLFVNAKCYFRFGLLHYLD